MSRSFLAALTIAILSATVIVMSLSKRIEARTGRNARRPASVDVKRTGGVR